METMVMNLILTMINDNFLINFWNFDINKINNNINYNNNDMEIIFPYSLMPITHHIINECATSLKEMGDQYLCWLSKWRDQKSGFEKRGIKS